MSEQQNADLIRNLFQAFGRGDVQMILDHCTPDCEFYCPGPSMIPYTGLKKGHAEIQEYFDQLIGTQSDPNLSIAEYVAQGETVVAIGRYSARVKSTGKMIDSPVVLTFHLRDGRVAKHMVIGDTAALADSYTAASAAGR